MGPMPPFRLAAALFLACAATASAVPQNPYMAKGSSSNIHNDTWMSDAYSRPGPTGAGSLTTQHGAYPPSLCGSIAFDTRGRLLSVCPSAIAAPTARIFDPRSLAILGEYALPTAPDPPGTKTFQNFTGGGYFYLDNRDEIVTATKTSHIVVLAEKADGSGFVKRSDYDVSDRLKSDERITSALPDFQGRIWFVSKKNGRIGILERRTGAIGMTTLKEEIENSFAVDRDAVYIVSDKRMYRFSARNGVPRVDWKSTYRNSGIVKPSQVDAGSGTTPTIMPGGFVSITDNADPMDVVVYRTAKKLRKGQRRVVCQVPVFGRGASATENSLLSAGRSLYVENNYGYQDPFGPTAGAVTAAGFARVDVARDGRSCRKVWTNTTEHAPTVVPKLSTVTGLIYAYVYQDDGTGRNAWQWAAIRASNGKTAWRKTASTELLNGNNNYAGLAIGPDGTAYLGTIGGLEGLRDGT